MSSCFAQARVGRSTPRTGFGNERGFRRYLGADGGGGGGNRRYSGSGEGNGGRPVPPAGSRDRTDSGEPSDRNPRTGAFSLSLFTVLPFWNSLSLSGGRLDPQVQFLLLPIAPHFPFSSFFLSSQIHPFCSTGLRPVAPPCSLLHPFSRRFEKGLVRGRSSSPTASHRASTTREPAAPPLPLLTKRDDYPAGDSGGRNSGGRCPSRPLQEPLLQLPRFLHPSRGGRGRAVNIGWRS